MKGDKIIRILELLKESTLDGSSLLEAFLSAGYGASVGRIKYLAGVKNSKRQKNRALFEEFVRERQRFHNLVSYLKSDGIISETITDDKKLYRIVEKGKKKLAALLASKQNYVPLSQYPKIDGKTFTIITFDIPEKEKKKRNWFRATLLQLGYKTIQRSVLLGKTKIPQSLIDDLRRLKMIEYVEIFEITKTGSLRHLI